MNTDLEIFKEKYRTILQTKAQLADTQNLWGNIGRGAGKSSEMLAPRLIRISYAMKGAPLLLVAPTYTSLLDNILPKITTYLKTKYIRGYHYEFNKTPPKHFLLPKTDITDFKRTLSFAWGTIVKYGSMDRPESVLGSDYAHVFVDELLRIPESGFIERIVPTLRGNRHIFGYSHYFGGITGFSSTPNFDSDHDWWLRQKENMDVELIEEIMAVALRVDHAKYAIKTSLNAKIIAKNARFVTKWEQKLTDKRRNATTFIEGSAFSNLLILGLDYITNQLQISKANLEKFKLTILGIRPGKVKDMFIGKFETKHIYTDSYLYDYTIDLLDIDGNFKRTSKDLKYCDPNKAIIAGYDPGNFMSMNFAQEKDKTLRVFKNMYVYYPEEHFELALKINKYFKHHSRKTMFLHYDRAGNQRKTKYLNNPKGDTDATILKSELELLGWNVQLMSLEQRTIFHWEHYVLLNILFGEKDFKTPRIRICQHECEELISSINMSPLKRSDGVLQLDKSAEKRLDLEDQALWTPQLATSLMYMLWGLYNKYMPEVAFDHIYFEGF